MSPITDDLQKEIEALDLKLWYEERICMWEISKDMRGAFTDRVWEDQKCERTECLTQKGRVVFAVHVRPNFPCDSVAARAFDGDIRGELVFAYIENAYRRGYHIGRFDWNGTSSRLIGRMAGVTNAGTHRSPLSSCEPCDPRGHMEGRLDAVVVDGEHKGCRVLATYVIAFDHGMHTQNTAIMGTLEGVLICSCEG